MANTKITLKELSEKIKKSLKRERAVLKELEDDNATLKYIETQKQGDIEFPNSSAYTSYQEWEEKIKKEIDAGLNSIKKIALQKEEVKALEYYIKNAPEDIEE